MNDVTWIGTGEQLPERRPENGPGQTELASFRELYFATLPHVYGYLLRRVAGSSAVAEDLTQETYLAAVGELRSNPELALSVPWLIGVARHKLVDHFRRIAREERKLRLVMDNARKPSCTWSDLPAEQVLASLGSLPALQRVAIGLRYLDDLPVPDVARHLGRSVRATESLLARGRDGLRRHYLEHADD